MQHLTADLYGPCISRWDCSPAKGSLYILIMLFRIQKGTLEFQ